MVCLSTSNKEHRISLARVDRVLPSVAVLAVLYFARDVLVPITLAVILSLLIAPFVRWLRRIGFGHTGSVLTAVVILMSALTAVGMVIVSQLGHIASSLPKYEKTIQFKLHGVEELTRGGVTLLTGGTKRAMTRFAEETATPPDSSDQAPPGALSRSPDTNAPVPYVQLGDPSPWQVLKTIATNVWVPVETTGIVLVVLLFVLLEQEALRDRLIRLVGSHDLRATTNALHDAGLRLSRFFVSQFLVNLGVGAAIGIGLAVCGIPNAPLWAALTLVLRFVPFVGVPIVAVFATLLAAAVAPDWTPALLTLGIFLIVELVAGQGIEPHFYGRTTGLSPLTVVIAAIFWSWLWGPVGLVVSTPMTLCLLVAGRHTRALRLLDVILGNTPALTMPQRFYQRALSGDSEEIISSARAYLARNSFAAYCDSVLVPALQLGGIDFDAGLISEQQRTRVSKAVLDLISELGETPIKRSRRRYQSSVLDDTNVGRALRRQRELRDGRWQGPLNVARGSVVLCVALGSTTDELATELLVRILRAEGIDARHFLIDDLNNPAPPEASSASVSLCYLVGTRAREGGVTLDQAAAALRTGCPGARLVTLFFPEILTPTQTETESDPFVNSPGLVDRTANSFVEALQICGECQGQPRAAEKRSGTG